MAQVIWSPYSEKRLDETCDFIALDAPERAANFVLKILDSTRNLKDFPESGGPVPENNAFRQVVVQGYRIIYRLHSDTIEIVTIIGPGQLFRAQENKK